MPYTAAHCVLLTNTCTSGLLQGCGSSFPEHVYIHVFATTCSVTGFCCCQDAVWYGGGGGGNWWIVVMCSVCYGACTRTVYTCTPYI